MTLDVVVSQGPSDNPRKRDLEASLVRALVREPGIELLVVPHLYDLDADSEGTVALRNLPGDIAMLSWLYSRAARWVLHAWGVRGPQRRICCLDLKTHSSAAPFLEEVRRIAVGQPGSAAATRLGTVPGEHEGDSPIAAAFPTISSAAPLHRWYPVIDYDRCTNCMECIDFCLFGVYGVDDAESILVEQPDQCRKGCPACSRVCPENAIMFPQHKTPVIAGGDGTAEQLKLDLSGLFGAPEREDEQRQLAAAEREQQFLVKRHEEGVKPADQSIAPAENLDRLLDALDDFDK